MASLNGDEPDNLVSSHQVRTLPPTKKRNWWQQWGFEIKAAMLMPLSTTYIITLFVICGFMGAMTYVAIIRHDLAMLFVGIGMSAATAWVSDANEDPYS